MLIFYFSDIKELSKTNRFVSSAVSDMVHAIFDIMVWIINIKKVLEIILDGKIKSNPEIETYIL